ncbi:MAG TPA: hypothetical protein VNI02_07930 [Blastocatellia bacterium]|jgi:hypothetical protein|nr:hypothetical protein [Blastocatellia bacterium]
MVTMEATRRRTGELARKFFEVALAHPEGVPYDSALKHIKQSIPLPPSERDTRLPLLFMKSVEEIARLGIIASVKAGWLTNQHDIMSVTELGRRAYSRYQDPEEFMTRAGRRSFMGWLSVSYPRPYLLACKAKDRLMTEYMVIRRVGPRQLSKSAFRRSFKIASDWQESLPLQCPRRIVIPGLNFDSAGDLLNYLDSTGVDYSQGGHTVYLPPASVKASAFQVLTNNYPQGAGVKIVKNPGGVDDSDYICRGPGLAKGESLIHRKLTHSHRQLTLVANLMFSKDVGPRLYDLVELQCGDHLWTAYVIEHVDGRTPELEECEAGLGKIRALKEQGFIKITIPDNDEEEDFRCPGCNNNALVDGKGKFHYIDFQNFLLVDYGSYLKGVAVQAADETHFGDKSLLRGGRYLYQSVPGLALPGKRKIDDRIRVLCQLMESSGVSVKDRLVLDVGCNIGMMIAQYLKLGARWCHGWDRGYVAPHTEKLLLALGCTRFSLSGCDIDRSREIEADLPEILKPSLDGCVISYLAVRGHLGWLDSLARIPWSFMIYEGHEGETQKDFEAHMDQLRSVVNFRPGVVSSYRDGDSDSRTVAILLREAKS